MYIVYCLVELLLWDYRNLQFKAYTTMLNNIMNLIIKEVDT